MTQRVWVAIAKIFLNGRKTLDHFILRLVAIDQAPPTYLVMQSFLKQNPTLVIRQCKSVQFVNFVSRFSYRILQ